MVSIKKAWSLKNGEVQTKATQWISCVVSYSTQTDGELVGSESLFTQEDTQEAGKWRLRDYENNNFTFKSKFPFKKEHRTKQDLQENIGSKAWESGWRLETDADVCMYVLRMKQYCTVTGASSDGRSRGRDSLCASSVPMFYV